jgi:hypothetical protein
MTAMGIGTGRAKQTRTLPVNVAVFNREMQTALVDPAVVRMDFTTAMLIFERPAVALAGPEVDLSAIQCDTTVRHISFHRFTGFQARSANDTKHSNRPKLSNHNDSH